MSIPAHFNVNDDTLRESFLEKTLHEAIASLGEPVQPEWGNLTARHMVEHLLLVFEISNGKVETPCATPEDQIPRMQKFLYINRPIPRGFQAPFLGSGLPELRFETLDVAKTALRQEIEIFLTAYKNNSPAKYINPVFGLIGVEDWHRHHYKHCFHHLLQFNLIEEIN